MSSAGCTAALLRNFFWPLLPLGSPAAAGVKMEKSVRVFDEQYLVQSTADLLALKAEIQKLKDLIRVAEAAKRSRSVRQSPIALAS